MKFLLLIFQKIIFFNIKLMKYLFLLLCDKIFFGFQKEVVYIKIICEQTSCINTCKYKQITSKKTLKLQKRIY